MFEKEAEEAIMKKYPASVQGYKSLIKNWKEGAEVGYNKANEQLKQQIEKMKCCSNCKHGQVWADGVYCTISGEAKHLRNDYLVKALYCVKWELAE